jgi:hypothetical protein
VQQAKEATMSIAKPFTWVVRLTVSPLWVADGFSLSDERITSMLQSELSSARGDEVSAQVINAPSAFHIARTQGYSVHDPRGRKVIDDLEAGTPKAGEVRSALIAARDLLDSVAFVSQPGDTESVLSKVIAAIEALNPRQGEAVEYDA